MIGKFYILIYNIIKTKKSYFQHNELGKNSPFFLVTLLDDLDQFHEDEESEREDNFEQKLLGGADITFYIEVLLAKSLQIASSTCKNGSL